MQHNNTPTATPQTTSPQAPWNACLGLHLGTREIGFALATREHLIDYGVINIRKISSSEDKQARFRKMVCHQLDRFPGTNIALVVPWPTDRDKPLIRAMRAWLDEEAARRDVTLHCIEREHAKKTLTAAPPDQATNRRLARTLAKRFPRLQRHVPHIPALVQGHLAPQQPRTPQPQPSSKERYWNWMFLALAAALTTVDQTRTAEAAQASRPIAPITSPPRADSRLPTPPPAPIPRTPEANPDDRTFS